jgi:hypothetical protein
VELGIVAVAQVFDRRDAAVTATPETSETWVMWAAEGIDRGIDRLYVSCVHNWVALVRLMVLHIHCGRPGNVTASWFLANLMWDAQNSGGKQPPGHLLLLYTLILWRDVSQGIHDWVVDTLFEDLSHPS